MNGDGTPVLGHAQRGAACEAPPPTITRELQALMAGMRLEDGADMEQVGMKAEGCGRVTGRSVETAIARCCARCGCCACPNSLAGFPTTC
jgi:hypothetical protein